MGEHCHSLYMLCILMKRHTVQVRTTHHGSEISLLACVQS